MGVFPISPYPAPPLQSYLSKPELIILLPILKHSSHMPIAQSLNSLARHPKVRLIQLQNMLWIQSPSPPHCSQLHGTAHTSLFLFLIVHSVHLCLLGQVQPYSSFKSWSHCCIFGKWVIPSPLFPGFFVIILTAVLCYDFFSYASFPGQFNVHSKCRAWCTTYNEYLLTG